MKTIYTKLLTGPFQIGWPELRSIAGVPKLTSSYLNQLNKHLRDLEILLVECDSFLLVARQQDLSHARTVPARLVEQYLPDFEDDDDFEVDEDELDDSADDVAVDEDDTF